MRPDTLLSYLGQWASAADYDFICMVMVNLVNNWRAMRESKEREGGGERERGGERQRQTDRQTDR